MGVLTLCALVLIVAKALGFLALSWWWCFAPLAVDVVIAMATLIFGVFAARKATSIIASNCDRRVTHPKGRTF